MSQCFHLYTQSQLVLPEPHFLKLYANPEHVEDMFFQGILTDFSSILNQAFKVLEEKCMRQGEGLYFYWHVSAAYGLVQSRLDHERSASLKLEATDRIAKLYHKILAFQEGPKNPATIPSTALPRSEAGFNSPGSWFYSANVLGVCNNVFCSFLSAFGLACTLFACDTK